MIINQFDIVGRTFSPLEHEPPLAVDSNAVLSFAITAQRLQMIGRGHAEFVEYRSGGNHSKLPSQCGLDIGGNSAFTVFPPERFKLLASEASNHAMAFRVFHYTA